MRTETTKKIDTLWFKDQLADRKMSQRKLASLMGLDPAAMSLLLRGKRKISVNEAGDISRLLNVPLTEVMLRAGIKEARTNVDASATAPQHHGLGTQVVGWIDSKGAIHNTGALGPDVVPTPPGVGPDGVALRVQTDDLQDGWLVYYIASPVVAIDAVGQLCVVTLADGTQMLRTVRRGYEPGAYALGGGMVEKKDGFKLKSAAPVLWMKQR